MWEVTALREVNSNSWFQNFILDGMIPVYPTFQGKNFPLRASCTTRMHIQFLAARQLNWPMLGSPSRNLLLVLRVSFSDVQTLYMYVYVQESWILNFTLKPYPTTTLHITTTHQFMLHQFPNMQDVLGCLTSKYFQTLYTSSRHYILKF